MRVTVVCFGAMREYLPDDADGNLASIEVPSDATVGAAMDALGAPRRLAFSVLVDGRHAGLDAGLHAGAEITLMPPFAGGSVPRQEHRAAGRARL